MAGKPPVDETHPPPQEQPPSSQSQSPLPPPSNERFEQDVGEREARKQRARQRGESFLSWLGTFGLVGWSIALPTVAAVALGMWLDRRFDDTISWTLTLLFAGLVVGCALAWYWVRRESSK
jgi:ATP synthase protein I